MAEYEPGACNIDAEEQRRRYALGAVSFAATLGLLFAIYVADLPTALALATFLPLFGTAEGYFQGRYQFCAGYALLGVYNVGDDGIGRTRVADADARRADRRRALRVHAYAALTALAGTILIYGVGLLIL